MAVEQFSTVTGELELTERSFDDTTTATTATEAMDPMMHSYTDMATEMCDWGVGKYGIEEIPTEEIKSPQNVDEIGDPPPECASKPHGYIELEKALEKLDESREMMDVDDFQFPATHSALEDTTKRREASSPDAEEVSRFINDKSAYIEEVFKCMLRGISNSKLNIVKNNWSTTPQLSSVTELDDETDNLDDDSGNKDDDVPLPGTSETTVATTMTPEMKIRELVRNLDYFIDILCSIKSSDASDTYSIIVLYEKLIFDIKSEISSLSKSLKIYRTIVGKGATN